MKKLKLNKIVYIGLYTLSVLLLIYFVYALYVSSSYIGSLMKQDQVSFWKDFGQIIQYIMTNTFSYLFYSICLGSIGYIMKNIFSKKIEENTLIEEISHK